MEICALLEASCEEGAALSEQDTDGVALPRLSIKEGLGLKPQQRTLRTYVPLACLLSYLTRSGKPLLHDENLKQKIYRTGKKPNGSPLFSISRLRDLRGEYPKPEFRHPKLTC